MHDNPNGASLNMLLPAQPRLGGMSIVFSNHPDRDRTQGI